MPSAPPPTNPSLDRLDASKNVAISRLREFLAIPSVSTDPAYQSHVRRGAEWVAEHLRGSGLRPRIMPTDGHPVVFADSGEATTANATPGPTVLFYGHYDVQPPDPAEQWTNPPFAPTIRDGAIHARGASDDKGQVAAFLEALRAWHDSGGSHTRLPCRVKVLIEGEEEMGSVHLERFVENNRDMLDADFVLVSDTSMWDEHTPAITYGLRGLLYYDLKLHGPTRDLHSGVYGGTLANPAILLTRILGNLFDEQQRVTIPGFYDDVAPLGDHEQQQWAALGFDENAFLGKVGVEQPYGEANYSTLQRRWARPACDINGLYGGYGGEGAKTIIPSLAGAKVSFRLAANQRAQSIGDAFEQWLRAHDTHGCRWEITRHGAVDAMATPVDSPWIAAAQSALEQTAGRRGLLVREGATIPVGAWFKSVLGLDSVFLGFGLESDRIHSPDEHLSLDRFTLAARTHAALLGGLGTM